MIDVSVPHRMREVGAYVSANPGGEVSGVAVAGGYAYLAAGEAGLRVVDVFDPAAPSLRHTFHVGGFATSVAVSGAHAFLSHTARSIKDPDGSLNSDWFDQGLFVFDISRPTRPKRVGALESGPLIGGVWADGNRAYFDTGLDGIRAVDVSNPASPRDIGSFGLLVSDVAAANTHVYLAKGTKGLYVAKRLRQARSPDDGRSNTPPENPTRK